MLHLETWMKNKWYGKKRYWHLFIKVRKHKKGIFIFINIYHIVYNFSFRVHVDLIRLTDTDTVIKPTFIRFIKQTS